MKPAEVELFASFVQGERPDNSGKEDVVINNLFLNHEVPQTGTSNVNIIGFYTLHTSLC